MAIGLLLSEKEVRGLPDDTLLRSFTREASPDFGSGFLKGCAPIWYYQSHDDRTFYDYLAGKDA